MAIHRSWLGIRLVRLSFLNRDGSILIDQGLTRLAHISIGARRLLVHSNQNHRTCAEGFCHEILYVLLADALTDQSVAPVYSVYYYDGASAVPQLS